MVYWVYNFFLTLGFFLSLPVLPLFFFLGRRFSEGLPERFGFYPRQVREPLRGSRPIWIHAVSVGEVLSAACLVDQLQERFPERKILLSTFTSGGRRIARQAVGAVDAVILLPLDHPWIVRRVLNLFDPCLVIFLETEIWPNFMRCTYLKGIPTLLLSGRLSPRAFNRYFFFRPLFSKVVQQFNAAGMQSEEDAERIVGLGVDRRKVCITGNLKHASWEKERAGNSAGNKLKLNLRNNPDQQVLVAGSTHRGEEDLMLDVFLFLRSRFPDLLMVLAPRHPHRFYEVERLLQKKKVRYERKSQMNGSEQSHAEVIFLDTLGDLPAFYSLADVAFVGGSMVDAGGHNLMEPARWRKPMLFGPYMTNFAELAAEIKQKGGGIEVRGREDLIREISGLLADRRKAQRMGELAYAVVQGDRGVVDRSMDLVARYVDGR